MINYHIDKTKPSISQQVLKEIIILMNINPLKRRSLIKIFILTRDVKNNILLVKFTK